MTIDELKAKIEDNRRRFPSENAEGVFELFDALVSVLQTQEEELIGLRTRLIDFEVKMDESCPGLKA